MRRMTDNGPALRALKALGYCLSRFESVSSVRDSFWVKAPAGKERRIKIQKSGPPSGDRGRHRFGIAFRDFGKVDDYVLWASDELVLLIFPASYLAGVLQGKRDRAQINDHQWVVNIYFDRHGEQELVPVGFGEEYPVTRFAHGIPDEV